MSLTPVLRVRKWPRCHRVVVQMTLRHNSSAAVSAAPEHDDATRKAGSKKARRRPSSETRSTIFSGIQPTGVPHLGNYLGALRQWKQFQDEKEKNEKNKKGNDSYTNYTLLYSIVDLHALTHQQTPAELLRQRRETFASLLAIGLNPNYTSIFFQSQIPAHSQLMWYLSTVASTGYLSRMTQWKSKLGVSEDATIDDQAAREKLRLGLFSYPVLQAADILLYQATVVPVGEDQQQHVEFARNLARSFNSQYRTANNGRDFFRVPKAKISPAKRIMSLKDPTVKMSKSHPDPNSRILITDKPDDVRSKIKGALTDSTEGVSYDVKTRPGVSNLIEILKHVTNSDASCEDIASDLSNHSMRAFKEHVAEEIVKCLDGFCDRFEEALDTKNDAFADAQNRGQKVASSRAGRTIIGLHQLMGLNRLTTPEATISSSQAKKDAVEREQQQQEKIQEEEPDVVPQKDQGVDRPIAS